MIVALTPGCVLAGVSGGIAFPVIPSVGMRVGLPLALIGFILAANRFVRVLVAPLVGMCVDRFGGRRTLLVGLAVQVVVMLLFVLAVVTPHAGAFFLAGRIVHGFGSACVFVAASALALHGGEGGRVGGAVRAMAAVGVPTGLVLGGFLSDWIGEVATFEAAGAALVVAFGLAATLVPDLRVTAGKRSLRASLASFLDRRMIAIGALGFASAFAGSGMVLTTTSLVVHARHLSAYGLPERATASLLMGWLVVSEAIGLSPFGRLGDRYRAHAKVAFLGLLLTIPALGELAYARTLWAIAFGTGLLGLAVAALGPSLLALVGRLVAPERRGLGVGALQVATDAGAALGPMIGTALFTESLSTPYLASAAVSLLLVPFGIVLVRAELP